MTNSNLFKAAHKLTKEIILTGDSYSATFGLCLKFINEQKKETMETVFTGIDDGDEYTLTINPIETGFYGDKFCDMICDIAGESDEVRLRADEKNISKWMEDNLGLYENAEIETFLTDLF